MCVCSKAQAFPPSAPVLPAEGPKLGVRDFAVGQQLVLSRLMCGRGLWRRGSRLAQTGWGCRAAAEPPSGHQPRMGRWQFSSSCDLLCGLLEGCF